MVSFLKIKNKIYSSVVLNLGLKYTRTYLYCFFAEGEWVKCPAEEYLLLWVWDSDTSLSIIVEGHYWHLLVGSEKCPGLSTFSSFVVGYVSVIQIILNGHFCTYDFSFSGVRSHACVHQTVAIISFFFLFSFSCVVMPMYSRRLLCSFYSGLQYFWTQ